MNNPHYDLDKKAKKYHIVKNNNMFISKTVIVPIVTIPIIKLGVKK